MDEYKSEHLAPDKNDYPIWDLTQIYPDDVYSSDAPRLYGEYGGNSMDREAISILQRVKDKPRKRIKIYRAVPNLNVEIDNQIRKYNQSINYFYEYGFFKMGDDLADGIKDLYRAYPYDEMKQKTVEHLQSEVEKLKKKRKPSLKIEKGNWVTLTKEYAVGHGRSELHDFKVVTKTVPVSTIFTDGNSIHEFGYDF
jgi:predicted ribosome quality control (RQC) complex YloA/Tae2 family protein